MKPFFIGLTGYSGAGKSTLADHLEGQGGVKRFRFDAFYKDLEECPRTEDGRLFWDLPESLHLDDAYEALKELKEGNDVLLPNYNRGLNRRIGASLFTPAPIILAEGLMLFTDERIRSLFDLKVFLDVSEELALRRRLLRQPDYDTDYHWKYAMPSAREHVAPAKLLADVILDGTPEIPAVAAQADASVLRYLGVTA